MQNSCFFHRAELQSSSQGLGFMLSFLCLTAQHSHVALTASCIGREDGLICLISGSLGQSDILSAKNDAEKNLCLSCPLKVT